MKSDLHQFVDVGIVFEDQFIEVYFKALQDEGFMGLFGKHEKEARKFLNTMIKESTGHKKDLEKLKRKMT